MRNRIDIDPKHSRAIVQEIGERLRAFLKEDPELPGSLSRPQETGLIFPTLGRNSILTWSQIMIKTPIAIAATDAVGLSFAQPALGQSDWSQTSIRYNG
jgi:hypothetical protein